MITEDELFANPGLLCESLREELVELSLRLFSLRCTGTTREIVDCENELSQVEYEIEEFGCND